MDKISPIKRRILKYLDTFGITRVDFCEKTGISYANMKGKGLESELSGDKIAKILSLYSDLSADWLLNDQEPMLRDSSSKNKVNTAVIGKGNKIGNITTGSTIANNGDDDRKVEFLTNENLHLKTLLEEKERLIQVLLKNN